MSHERSITVGFDGRFFNLPTVVDGKQVEPDEAVRAFQNGRIQPLGPADGFGSLEAAEKAARQRSKRSGKKRSSRSGSSR